MASRSHPACYVPGVALLGTAFNLIVLVVAPLARPDLNPLRQALSYYAIGPWGSLQAIAFAAIGVASVAVAIGLSRSPPESRWIWLVAPSLAVAGVAGIGLAAYPMGAAGPATIFGDTHQTAGTVGGVAQLVAALGFVLAVRSDGRWRPFLWPATAALTVAIAGAVLTQIEIWWPETNVPMGLSTRLVFVPLVLLWGAVAWRLRQRCLRPISRSAAAP